MQERLGHDAVVTAVAASPDSRYIATGDADGTIIIWTLTKSEWKSPLEIRCLQSTVKSVVPLQFSNAGDFLAATSGSSVFIWRLTDLYLTISFGGHPKLSSIWGCNTTFDYVDLSTLGTGHGEISVSATTARIPTGSAGRPIDDTTQSITSVHSRRIVLGHGNSINGYCGIARSSSGTIIVAFDARDKTFSIWRRTVTDHTATTSEYDLHHLACSYDGMSYCTTIAGEELIVAGSRHGTILWWDISSFPLTTTEPSGALSLRLSPDSKACSVDRLYMSPSGSFLVAACTDCRMDSWESLGVLAVLRRADNIRVGFERPHILLHGHSSNIEAACISQCERYIATASRDTTVRLWSAKDGELLFMFVNHDAAVTHVAFSPDGRTLASADENGEVCLHDLSWFADVAPIASVDG